MERPIRRDRVVGMFCGHILGDVLGLPHEFNRSRGQGLDKYSDVAKTTTYSGRGNTRTTALGQGSDDTEMMMALLWVIVNGRGSYDRNCAITAYMEFASGSKNLGKNTRKLLAGTTNLSVYSRRYVSVFGVDTADPRALGYGDFAREWTQSNGSIMRAAPLVLCPETCEKTGLVNLVRLDTSITNPGQISIALCALYVGILRLIVGVADGAYDCNAMRAAILDYAMWLSEIFPAALVDLQTIVSVPPGDVTGSDKGWSRHAVHIAYWCAVDPGISSYRAGIRRVVCMGGDTDTNGAIGGAVLGARFGIALMESDQITRENVDAILRCDTSLGTYPRPRELTGAALPDLLRTIPMEN